MFHDISRLIHATQTWFKIDLKLEQLFVCSKNALVFFVFLALLIRFSHFSGSSLSCKHNHYHIKSRNLIPKTKQDVRTVD